MSLQTQHSGSEICIREFQPGDEVAFRKLNEEWITRYFRLELKDEKTLGDPRREILDQDGRILFATANGRCVGCCALIRMNDSEFEVAKMAVTPEWQGFGIGRKLLQAVIEVGRKSGAGRLYLETNHSLTPAIRLYESLGFKQLAPEKLQASPYARADVYMEMVLT